MRVQFAESKVSEPCSMSSLIWFSQVWPVFPTLFSWVRGNHQEWALWSNPISGLSSPIRTQPALHMDHRGPTWKHHQVWTALIQLFAPSLVFFSQTLLNSTSFSRTLHLACFLVHFFAVEVNGFTIENQSFASCYWSVVQLDLGERKHPLKAPRLETCIKFKFVQAMLLHMCTFVTFNIMLMWKICIAVLFLAILRAFFNLTWNIFY